MRMLAVVSPDQFPSDLVVEGINLSEAAEVISVYEFIACDTNKASTVADYLGELRLKREESFSHGEDEYVRVTRQVSDQASCIAIQKTLAMVITISLGYYNPDMHEENLLIDADREAFTYGGLSCPAIRVIDLGLAFELHNAASSSCAYYKMTRQKRYRSDMLALKDRFKSPVTADTIRTVIKQGLFQEYFSPLSVFTVDLKGLAANEYISASEAFLKFLKILIEKLNWLTVDDVAKLEKCSRRWDGFDLGNYSSMSRRISNSLSRP